VDGDRHVHQLAPDVVDVVGDKPNVRPVSVVGDWNSWDLRWLAADAVGCLAR
jgi:hypothetical protein